MTMRRKALTSASPQFLFTSLLVIQHTLGIVSLPLTGVRVPPLSISLSSEDVALGDSVTIRCHVNPNSEEGALMAQSSTMLHCPAAPSTTFCFQNCRPQDECNNGNCQPIPTLGNVACRTITHANGETVHEYTVKHVTAEWMDRRHPGFACSSAAEKTEWIQLREKVKSLSEIREKKTSLPPIMPQVPTTTSATVTTTRKPKKTTMGSDNKSTNVTTAVIFSPSDPEDDGVQWLSFLRNSSSGIWGFWTPEMIIIIALVALALSMLINCFCCVKWIVGRHNKRRKKLKGSGTFCGHSDFNTTGVLPTVAWFPADPRILPPGPLSSQQITPSSAFRRSIAIPDESLGENHRSWSPFGSANAARTHPEGKAANGSTMGNSACRNSDSSSSFAHSGAPQPIQLLSSSAAYPIGFEPVGWSGPVTPRSKNHAHRLRHHIVPSYYVGLRRASSRETVFSERPMSEIGFEPNTHHPHHYVPIVVSPNGGIRASQPQLASVPAYGTPLCGPADVSLIEKSGAGDGASGRGGSGSPKPGMTVLLPAAVIGHQYGVLPPPSSSTERSSVPLLKADLTLKSKTMAPGANLGEGSVVNEGTGKSAAEVRMWLQSMPIADKDHQSRLPTKLADSLNTEYDVASDWSEREPMLLREKPSSEETAPTE